MNWELPRRATGRFLSEVTAPGSPAPVPTEFSGELLFNNGVSAGFYCSFITANEQCAMISGTKGYLRVSDFVVPFDGPEICFEINNTTHVTSGMQARWRRVTVPEYSNNHPTAQESNLFRNVANQVRSGRLNDTWPEVALKTQQVMNACFVSAREGNRLVEV
jgi:predicted dehydrogenase